MQVFKFTISVNNSDDKRLFKLHKKDLILTKHKSNYDWMSILKSQLVLKFKL